MNSCSRLSGVESDAGYNPWKVILASTVANLSSIFLHISYSKHLEPTDYALSAYTLYSAFKISLSKGGGRKPLKEGKELSTIANLRVLAALATVNCLLRHGLYPLIHEGGHALAFKACVQGPFPPIVVATFDGAACLLPESPRPLTPFGTLLGPERSTALIVAGGPLITTGMISLLLLASKHFCQQRKRKRMGQLLEGIAFLFYFHESATNGLRQLQNPSNDFTLLQRLTGLPALVSIAAMAIPFALMPPRRLVEAIGVVEKKKNDTNDVKDTKPCR